MVLAGGVIPSGFRYTINNGCNCHLGCVVVIKGADEYCELDDELEYDITEETLELLTLDDWIDA